MASTTHAQNTPPAKNLTVLWQPYVSECVGYNEEGGFTIGISRNGEPMESKEDAFKFANQMMAQIPEAIFASVRRVEVLK
jgi:hypothetical protein